MKASDVPAKAMTAPPTTIPKKVVIMHDWDALCGVLLKQGFVIIEDEKTRFTTIGAEESVLVKAFNSHMRMTKKLKLRTRRISKTRWFCTL